MALDKVLPTTESEQQKLWPLLIPRGDAKTVGNRLGSSFLTRVRYHTWHYTGQQRTDPLQLRSPESTDFIPRG